MFIPESWASHVKIFLKLLPGYRVLKKKSTEIRVPFIILEILEILEINKLL